MRLSELELLKYGHFEGCQLSFPRGDPDLQIVFGANEAGKSTTMAAVGDLLFGFPHSTPYDFRFDPQLLRVGGVVESDEARISCRRKKGRKGTLLDADETAIDEAGLIAMLFGYSAESYQRMFSLDHIRLRAGGRAILSSQDDVGQAIFAAGSGLIGVTRILDDIDSEAKAIWTKRSGDRLYYAAQRTWDEARGRQKEAQVKPGAWDSRTKLANAVAALEDAAAKRATASERLSGWSLRWVPAIKSAGLNPEGPPASVRIQLDLLERLRGEVDEILRLEQRIDAIEADRSEFASAVRHQGDACGIPVDGCAAEDTLTDLVRASTTAQDAQRARADLRVSINVATGRLDESVAARARALARLQPLFDLAGTTDRASLLSTIRGADEVRGLRAEMLRLNQEILTAGGGPALGLLLAEVEAADSAELEMRSVDLQEEASSLGDRIAALTGEYAAAQSDFARLDAGPNAAIAAADAEQARSELAVLAETYVHKRAEAALLRAVVARYRALKQSPLVKRASVLFSRLTLGRYAGLLVDVELSRLSGIRDDQAVVSVDGMSEGTVDQLFLALRIAAVEDAVASGAKLPFLADDLFINYDNERAAAGFQVLAELARSTQVLFFTHHQHLLNVAQDALVPVIVSSCQLG